MRLSKNTIKVINQMANDMYYVYDDWRCKPSDVHIYDLFEGRIKPKLEWLLEDIDNLMAKTKSDYLIASLRTIKSRIKDICPWDGYSDWDEWIENEIVDYDVDDYISAKIDIVYHLIGLLH